MTAPTMNAAPVSSFHRLNRDSVQVLLVDDDGFQIELLTEQLQALGFKHIKGIQHGQAAADEIAIRASHYQLVFLDLSIPGQDGFKLMEALAQAGFVGALAIISGQDKEVLHAASLIAKLRRFTFLGAVAKPLNRVALAQLLTA